MRIIKNGTVLVSSQTLLKVESFIMSSLELFVLLHTAEEYIGKQQNLIRFEIQLFGGKQHLLWLEHKNNHQWYSLIDLMSFKIHFQCKTMEKPNKWSSKSYHQKMKKETNRHLGVWNWKHHCHLINQLSCHSHDYLNLDWHDLWCKHRKQ